MAELTDIDEQQAAADQRIADARQAERDLMEQLDHRGLVEVWNTVRKGLHCERFLESRTGKAVTERLMKTVIEAQTFWLLADDPLAPDVVNAHRRAQAAHMALFALDEILATSETAQMDLERIQQDLGDD